MFYFTFVREEEKKPTAYNIKLKSKNFGQFEFHKITFFFRNDFVRSLQYEIFLIVPALV